MSEKRFEVIDDSFSKWIVDTTLKEDKHEGAIYTAYDMCRKLNELFEENGQLKKANNMLYNENIQLRRILIHYKDLINDVKYLEEKGVFDGKKDKKNIWDVEPVVEKHS